MRINRSSSASSSVITRAVTGVICAGGFLVSVSILSERVMSVSSEPAVASAEHVLLPTLTVNNLTDTNDGVCDADCRLRKPIGASASFVVGFPALTQRAEEVEAGAGPWSEQAHVTAADGAPDDFFSFSVAISGDTAIVGANEDDTAAGTNAGSAHIFTRSGSVWTLQQKLTASDGAFGDMFGSSVAITGDTAIVGAIGHAGSAYVFTRSGSVWTQQQKLTASDSETGDNFGNSVALSGDTAIVGANEDNTAAGTNAGSSYVFTRSGSVWTEQQQLKASDGATDDEFGYSVAVSDDTAIVGAWEDDTAAAVNAGSAYVFTRSGGVWTQQQKLTALDGGLHHGFGISVAITGDTVIAGAWRNNAAYVFTRSESVWTLQKKLTASGGTDADAFGHSVSISDNTVVVGAHQVDTAGGAGAGSAYVFTRSGSVWTEQQKLTASDGAAFDRFGASVSLSGDTVIVGAYRDDTAAGTDAGSFYVYKDFRGAPFDFDGDGKTDIGIFRPPVGEWWYQRSSDGLVPAFQFGASTDRIVPADYTGDGKTDIAFFRPSTGEWYVLRSEDLSFYSFPFGTSEDVPATADYDADGKADPAVFRPSTTTWFIQRSSDNGTTIAQFGATGDHPVAADYDGDGRADLAIYRPSLGQWWINRSTLGVIAMAFGNSTDKAVPGDYTGDGKADVAFWRPSSGEWFILRSEDNSYYSVPFGISTDIPAPGDYDGDGKFDTTVFRPSNATWFVQRSTAGTLIQQFGASGDQPVPNAFVP